MRVLRVGTSGVVMVWLEIWRRLLLRLRSGWWRGCGLLSGRGRCFDETLGGRL